jgi:hypothetical protein
MATPIFSQQEMYNLFITNLQNYAPDLTDVNEGSINDSLGGVFSTGAVEIQKLIIDRFNKTFVELANGPDVTGGDDDLQTLLVDHFGTDFARPLPALAIGTATFSRPTTGAGNITIPDGTILKTKPDANGNVQRFKTVGAVTITGTSINASVIALASGTAGNVQAGTLIVIESTLLDQSITVSNAVALAGGTDKMSDADYREFARNKIETLRGATISAIKAAAKNVAGVVTATDLETLQAVIPYNIATGLPLGGATWFYIPNVVLYIADANGTASGALIAAVISAIASVRAAGVKVDVKAASPLTLNWTAALVLNPAGPNYATLASDTTLIKQAMSNYINTLPIGSSFSKTLANAAMLAIWGPGGTGDLTSFQTTVPTADVASTSVQKLIAGTMGTQ